MHLVEGPDRDKLEEEVSLDSAEESKWKEEDKKLSRPLMKLAGVVIVCLYPTLNLEPLLRH